MQPHLGSRLGADAHAPSRRHHLALAAVAGSGVVLLSAIVARLGADEHWQLDHDIRTALASHALPRMRATLQAAGFAGTVWWLHGEGRNEAAFAVAFAPVAAATVGQGFTSFLHQQRNPPDKSGTPDGGAVEASFPSGHTTGVTAEALSIAYILQHEGLSSAPVLAALVGWPLLVGITRVYRDRHWASDVLAGWIAGTAVAAVSALVYGGLRTRSVASASEGEGEKGMVALQAQAG